MGFREGRERQGDRDRKIEKGIGSSLAAVREAKDEMRHVVVGARRQVVLSDARV